MHKPKLQGRRKLLVGIGIFVMIIAAVAVVDYLYIKFAGTPVPAPQISRQPRVLGAGQPLTFVILGDSRVVGQGGDYEQGVAMSAAKHLAKTHQVTLHNFGVSGARARDVLEQQLPQAIAVKPDLVVILIGANDVTHLTGKADVLVSVNKTIEGLIAAKCDTKIVLTDSSSMWTVPRLPHPLRYVAGLRSKQFNRAYSAIAIKQGITYAPTAQITAHDFVHNRRNFAADLFHPSTQGYTLLAKALQPYLDKALAKQASHCK